MSDTVPLVHGTVYIGRKGVRGVKVRCYYCGRIHTHGAPYGDGEPGLRQSHCTTRPGEYYITCAPLDTDTLASGARRNPRESPRN